MVGLFPRDTLDAMSSANPSGLQDMHDSSGVCQVVVQQVGQKLAESTNPVTTLHRRRSTAWSSSDSVVGGVVMGLTLGGLKTPPGLSTG
jgi:hypothetical protein